MKIESIINYYKKHGFLKTLKRFSERIGFIFFHRSVYLIRLDLNSFTINLGLPHPVAIATQKDIQNNYYDSWFTTEEALARLEKGHRLFVISENNRIMASAWVEFNEVKIAYLELRFHIPDDVAYLTGRYTVPDLRRKGLASQLERGIFQYLKKEGYNYLLALTDITNVAALALNRRIGWEDYQLVHYKRYGLIKYFCVEKSNSNERKIFFTIFQAPEKMWKIFL